MNASFYFYNGSDFFANVTFKSQSDYYLPFIKPEVKLEDLPAKNKESTPNLEDLPTKNKDKATDSTS